MREIKFRSKAVRPLDKLNELDIEHVNGWVYGNLVMYDDIPFIVVLSLVADVYDSWVKVHPESVGQYTGLKDKNGREIYEGDLLQHPNGTIAEIKYLDDLAAFVAVYTQGGNTEMDYLDKEIVSKCKIVGNIYENPELLEVEGEMNEICPTCNGSGGIDTFEESIGEVVTIVCPDCGGSGEIGG